MGRNPSSYHPARFGGHRHCASGDLVFLVVEGQDSTCHRFNPSLLTHTKFRGVETWHRGAVAINTAQLHSSKPELRFCAGSYPARCVSEIRDGEDL